MYSRPYKAQSSGAVRAFEDAYAKEEFLRRTSVMGKDSTACIPDSCNKRATDACSEEKLTVGTEKCLCSEKTPPDTFRNPKNGFSGLLGDADGGDIILLFLIILFLTDKDDENDRISPILLAVLLFF